MARAPVAAALLLAAGCGTIPSGAPHAIAELRPTRGSQASGTVHFYELRDKVRVIARVAGLVPGGSTAFISTKRATAAPGTA